MRYQVPAIIEALCEFVFEPSQPWDMTVFGKFADKMPELVEREQGEVMAIDLKGSPDSLAQSVRREPRMRFYRTDRTRLAQVGKDLLAANVLAPYPHWAEFRAFIIETLSAYWASANPAAIKKVTLRYIDRIEPDASNFVLGDWLDGRSPYVPGFVLDADRAAHSRVQKQVETGIETVSVQLQLEAGAKPVIMLDTEIVGFGVEMGNDPVIERLNALHGRIIDVFESSISDRTRALLRPLA